MVIIILGHANVSFYRDVVLLKGGLLRQVSLDTQTVECAYLFYTCTCTVFVTVADVMHVLLMFTCLGMEC